MTNAYLPSIAWYNASRSAISTRAPPLWKTGKGGKSAVFFCARNRLRNAVSTSSDMVRPCRAASRLSWAMTVSSTLSVVFIWETISPIWVDGQPALSEKGTLICAHQPPALGANDGEYQQAGQREPDAHQRAHGEAAVEHDARHGKAETPHRRHRGDDEHGGGVGDGGVPHQNLPASLLAEYQDSKLTASRSSNRLPASNNS